MRYFFDNFHNDPTYTEGNLLSYSNPTLAAGTRMQNIVGGWTRTFSPTLLNEARVGYNHTFSRRFPPPGVPSMQDLGVRLPIYPALPSISEINANNFFNIGDNLEASFYRPGIELNDRMTWSEGQAQPAVRRRDGSATPSRSATSSAAPGTSSSPAAAPPAPATRSPISCSASSASSIRAPASTRTTWSTTGRLFAQDDFRVNQPADVEPGRPARVDAAMAREGRPHRGVHARATTRTTCTRPCSRRRRAAKRSAATRASPRTAPTRRPTTSARASASRGTSPATARPACAAAAARSTTSIATANRATAPSTRRRGTCACRWSGRRVRSPIRIAGRTDFNLITDADDRHAAGAVPEAGADRNARPDIQDAGDLQLQPHLRA